ncbi:Serine acetyltransferase [Sulfurovum sp. enrichment culture clone C5]|uniref:Serine acetyltransferase n=1 Tax=Sulfurovum sp. enrichment culture clone C5 TaxID=497650 RepID=A0A0S4XR77_9BACT|nr:Serine acetyltransferase [Sulfurovum sp. enrichment culture clone C5]
MLGRILIMPFGSIWKVKELCNRNMFFTKLVRIIYQIYQYENNSSIAWNSVFEGEPCFPHGMKGIFVSGGAKIGRNCVIFQQVTIGSVVMPSDNKVGYPTIGDNCYIGAGAKIIGNVNIGNNVRIGANAVVYKNVPNNSVVISGEQKITEKTDLLDNAFYSFQEKWVYFDDGKWITVEDKDKLRLLQCE